MARGLFYMLDIMRDELSLSASQYKKMATYCLYHSAVGYMAAGKRKEARKALLKLFKIAPSTALNLSNWRIHLAFGMYTKIVLGNPVTDLYTRICGRLKKYMLKIIKKIYRIMRVR